MVKNPPANARDAGSIPRSGRFPVKGNSNPLMVFLLGEFHGQRSPMGYNPQGRRELDKTERLTHTQLIYNVVMVSDAQQSESAMHIHTLEAAPPIL